VTRVTRFARHHNDVGHLVHDQQRRCLVANRMAFRAVARRTAENTFNVAGLATRLEVQAIQAVARLVVIKVLAETGGRRTGCKTTTTRRRRTHGWCW